MKIVIKFSKDEAEAYKAFEKTVRPDEVSSDVFAKSIFFNGIEAMNKELSRMVEEYIKENPDASGAGTDFSKAGVEIIEEAAEALEVDPSDVPEGMITMVEEAVEKAQKADEA